MKGMEQESGLRKCREFQMCLIDSRDFISEVSSKIFQSEELVNLTDYSKHKTI